MADQSPIEWTEATWNPIAGCSIVSPGCTNCYAMRRVAPRLAANPATPHYAGTVQPSKAGPVWTGKIGIASDRVLTAPLRWTKPRRIFVNSTSDLFHEAVPDEVIDRIFAVMALSPQHTFQVLTKRAGRMREYIGGWTCDGTRRLNIAAAAGRLMEDGDNAHDEVANAAWPLPNVWLGVSVEDQKRADERIPHLLATPAAIRFVSAEPLLGPIDFMMLDHGGKYAIDALQGAWAWRDGAELEHGGAGARLDWIIVGGESGNGARPMHPAWARAIRDLCKMFGTAFFFKQWGEWLPWEPEHGPCWVSQNGRSEDQHILFPTDFDNAPDWDDGLWAIDGVTTQAAFQRVGKKRAGRLLDGVEHNGFPTRHP